MMRRFLILGPLDGQPDHLVSVRTAADQRRPHAVLWVGGLLGPNTITQADRLKTWERCFQQLGQMQTLTAVVPGRHDVPLAEFLRVAKDAEVEYPNLRVVHATLWQEGDTALCGLGGELFENEDRIDGFLASSRATAEYFLRMLWRAEQSQRILLLSLAPPGPLGGDDGNTICGEFIHSYRPSLCAVAGPTQYRGAQRIAHSLVVNPGRLADQSACWVDLDRDQEAQVQLLNL